jgi:hypothetical protein
MHWKVAFAYREMLDTGIAMTLSHYGAAALSARSTAAALRTNDVGKAAIREAPMAIVDSGTLREQVTVIRGPDSSDAIASQIAGLSGGLVIEAYEVAR